MRRASPVYHDLALCGSRSLRLMFGVQRIARATEGLPALLAQDAQVLVQGRLATGFTGGLDHRIVAVVERLVEGGELVDAVDEQLVLTDGVLRQRRHLPRDRFRLRL